MIPKTLSYYGKIAAWWMSPNFRQNAARIKAMPLPKRIAFVCYDALRQTADKVAHAVDQALNGYDDIPRSELTDYTIRLLRADLIDKDSVIYAFGVAGHIETEEDIAKRHGATVYMFDPTPPATEYMKTRVPDPLLVFDPIGVWTTTGIMKFYTDRRSEHRNLSVTNMYHTDTYVEAPCYTLSDIMKKYGHGHIDVLKMDIEGSALPVLIHMLEKTDIRPRQIVGSLEKQLFAFDASLRDVAGVITSKHTLCNALHKEGYRVVTHLAAEFSAIRD